jgi:murein DD-endopeptidase MepM/ murein hydrolase activator NlpD
MAQGWQRRRVAHAHPIRDPRVPAWAPRPALGTVLPARRPVWPAIAAVALVLLVVAVAIGVSLNGGALLAASAGGAGSPSPDPAGGDVRASAGPSAATTPTPSPSLEPASLAPGLPSGYRWPLDHGRITTAFGPLTGGVFLADGVPWHDGIDIASFCGDRIVAAHDGVVLAAGRHVDQYLGWIGDIAAYHARLDAKNLWYSRAVIVITDDGNGYRSVYVHLYKADVTVGQQVKAGDFIGWEGETGYATGCHLHYSIFDPTDLGIFTSDPKIVARELLPAAEIARIDPLTILPPMSTTKVTWGWGAQPSAGSAGR